MKECQLKDNKKCTSCGECEMCDKVKNKTCNNCCECLDLPDYSGIMIDEIHTGGRVIKLNKIDKNKIASSKKFKKAEKSTLPK